MRDTYERLRGIQEAIKQITKYTDQGREEFDQNELVQTWVIYHNDLPSLKMSIDAFLNKKTE